MATILSISIPVIFLLSVGGMFLFEKCAPLLKLVDMPNDRSLHCAPKYRGGGIVFVLLWLISLIILTSLHFLTQTQFAGIFLPACLVSAVAFLDDLKGLSVMVRLLSYFLAGVILLFSLPGLHAWHGMHILEMLIILFCVAWSINLYNFMDGIDGLAAVEAIFVFAVGAILFGYAGAHGFMMICLLLCVAVLGFLIFNWPPSRVFMGDVGSTFLGCVIAVMAVMGHQFYSLPFWPWLIVYGLFLFDTTVTLIRRILRKEKISYAHRSHAYQRLVQSGWSHQEVLLACVVLNVILAILALCSFFFVKSTVVCIVLALIMLSVAYYDVERKRAF